MTNPTVLISGASVAGPALAFWLVRLGYTVTVVEKASSLRDGGYAVDFRGKAIEVLRRMGLLEAVRGAATNMGEMHYVNARGRVMATMPSEGFSGEVEIMRGDLARILYDATCADADYVFSDSIAAITQQPDCVSVGFASGRTQSYDIVVGADGVHSNTRALVFGPESEFLRPLGMGVSVFTAPNRMGLDYSGRLFPQPGTVAGIYSARQNREARAMLYFQATADEMSCRDPQRQQAIVREKFAAQGWQVPQILDDMRDAPDFYYDEICQVELEEWSRGRVVLLGDAADCASPLSGLGTGMAIVGAYVLAQELAAAGDRPTPAFARYQARMQPMVAGAQAFARQATKHFTPTSRFALTIQMLMMKYLFPLLPMEAMLKDILAAANSVDLDAGAKLPAAAPMSTAA
jgi:2-polyprenyl-6-methoxyphenol hydroxylase-like FAD-dependent oxidoreductase